MRKYWLVAPLGLNLIGLTLLGCGGDTTGPAVRSTAANAYWALRLNQHAITLAMTAPHNTIQLHATPMTAAGMSILSSASVNYTILDKDTSITVSASGLLTAKTPSYRASSAYYQFPVSTVVASLTIDGVTLKDTALVQVTATAPTVPLQRISMQPPAESLALYRDGHWLLQNDTRQLNLAQFDVNGDTVHNELIYLRSSDPNIGFGYAVSCFAARSWCVMGAKPQANVTFYVQLWYYGVDVSDSLRVRVGYPREGSVDTYQTTPLESRDVQLYWWPTTVELTAPARVFFGNESNTIPLDAIFDHPETVHIDTIRINNQYRFTGFVFPASAEGNIAPFYKDTVGMEAACAQATYDGTTRAADSTCLWGNRNSIRTRAFTTPGIYSYHTRFGNGGKIVVH